MLIDFDLGGKSGEASFPTVLLNEDLTGGRRWGTHRLQRNTTSASSQLL